MFMNLKWAMLLNSLSTAGGNNSSYQNVKEHAAYTGKICAQTTLHGVNNTHIEERMCKYRAGDRFMPGVLKFMRIAARN